MTRATGNTGPTAAMRSLIQAGYSSGAADPPPAKVGLYDDAVLPRNTQQVAGYLQPFQDEAMTKPLDGYQIMAAWSKDGQGKLNGFYYLTKGKPAVGTNFDEKTTFAHGDLQTPVPYFKSPQGGDRVQHVNMSVLDWQAPPPDTFAPAASPVTAPVAITPPASGPAGLTKSVTVDSNNGTVRVVGTDYRPLGTSQDLNRSGADKDAFFWTANNGHSVVRVENPSQGASEDELRENTIRTVNARGWI